MFGTHLLPLSQVVLDHDPNANPTLTDHPDLTLSIFPSLHSDRRSEPIIIETVLCMLHADA